MYFCGERAVLRGELDLADEFAQGFAGNAHVLHGFQLCDETAVDFPRAREHLGWLETLDQPEFFLRLKDAGLGIFQFRLGRRSEDARLDRRHDVGDVSPRAIFRGYSGTRRDGTGRALQTDCGGRKQSAPTGSAGLPSDFVLDDMSSTVLSSARERPRNGLAGIVALWPR
ncbi:MAG: hypothetical protein LBU76_07650, partial [Azoarcus sp.]|nr:hypothetical protein [Azoarcus sp.]